MTINELIEALNKCPNKEVEVKVPNMDDGGWGGGSRIFFTNSFVLLVKQNEVILVPSDYDLNSKELES